MAIENVPLVGHGKCPTFRPAPRRERSERSGAGGGDPGGAHDAASGAGDAGFARLPSGWIALGSSAWRRIRLAVASDVDDVAAVQQPVQKGGGHHLVAEDAAPLLEALVRCEHGRGVPLAPVDELEEEYRAALWVTGR